MSKRTIYNVIVSLLYRSVGRETLAHSGARNID